MRSTKKIIWGIILLFLAAGLIVFAFMPEASVFDGISVWKLLVGAVLLYWIINNLIFGKSLREHFDIFLPLGLLFVIFKSDIAGGKLNFIENWIVIVVALLLTAAVNLLLGDVGKSKYERVCADKRNSSGKSIIYLDVAERCDFATDNKLGSMHVYFQNTDAGDASQPVSLTFGNKLGETVIHVPSDWKVTAEVENKLGSFKVRPNPAQHTRELFVYGSNELGDTTICS